MALVVPSPALTGLLTQDEVPFDDGTTFGKLNQTASFEAPSAAEDTSRQSRSEARKVPPPQDSSQDRSEARKGLPAQSKGPPDKNQARKGPPSLIEARARKGPPSLREARAKRIMRRFAGRFRHKEQSDAFEAFMSNWAEDTGRQIQSF